MSYLTVVLNEQEAREARNTIVEIEGILASDKIFASLVEGMPATIGGGYRRAMDAHRRELLSMLDAFDSAKAGDSSKLSRRVGKNPGLHLIVARIARGFTQKELARKLGIKEQQIQRYESDRYSSISLGNYQKIASVLGLVWDLHLSDWIGSGWNISSNITSSEVMKVYKHARAAGWFEDKAASKSIESDSTDYLQKYVSEHMIKYGSPSLLRTGLNVSDQSSDLATLAWKARITRIAEDAIDSNNIEYNPISISWILELVGLSKHSDGPVLAQKFLLERGIVLVIERQVVGMKVDGAAFLVAGIPVIGLTLRRDSLDNFWFTLLHEVGHIVLHARTGLAVGFFDDTETSSIDELEAEADEFASNIIVPDEIWKRSPARISTSTRVIEKFSRDLNVNPALIFGKIRKERKSYAIFSDLIGKGQVRKQFSIDSEGAKRDEG